MPFKEPTNKVKQNLHMACIYIFQALFGNTSIKNIARLFLEPGDVDHIQNNFTP